MPPRRARIGSELRQTAWLKQIRPLHCSILFAKCQELHRPRSESPLQSICGTYGQFNCLIDFISMARAVLTIALSLADHFQWVDRDYSRKKRGGSKNQVSSFFCFSFQGTRGFFSRNTRFAGFFNIKTTRSNVPEANERTVHQY